MSALIRKLCELKHTYKKKVHRRLMDHFDVDGISKLTDAQAGEACALVQRTIDALPAPLPTPEPVALPAAPTESDANPQYARMREDIALLIEILTPMIGRMQVYGPQGGLWTKMKLLKQIGSNADKALAGLFDARESLKEANRLARMLTRI